MFINTRMPAKIDLLRVAGIDGDAACNYAYLDFQALRNATKVRLISILPELIHR